MGADVEFWTNEQPPLFNKTDINNLLQPYVDGERSMARVTDRFNEYPPHRTAVSSNDGCSGVESPSEAKYPIIRGHRPCWSLLRLRPRGAEPGR